MSLTDISVLTGYLQNLLNAPKWKFDKNLRKNLPDALGIYLISEINNPSAFVRAGRTTLAKGGLRQRVYQNHLMGNQSGNLCKQLMKDGICPSLKDAKDYIRKNLQVQVLVIEDDEMRKRVEYFMLAVLNPKYFF